jgi:transcriptional regulator with XRE-family HTH domain
MTKSEIASALRSCRKKVNLSGTKVIEKLKASGVVLSVKALYNWEKGRSQPDFNAFMGLCDIYGIDTILSAFGYDHKETAVSRPQIYQNELIERILLLDENDCKIVSAYIDGLSAHKRG